MKPFPLILSAPSGTGKTTMARKLLALRRDVAYAISATTRPRRANEIDGVDYFFLSDAEFIHRRDAGDFAESAEVHGRWYGTLRSEVSRSLALGRHVVMDIDVQGARAFSRAFPEAVLVFVLPPSLDAMLERLKMRNSESTESLGRRLETALREIEAVGEYHYVVVNDQVDAATAKVSAIIDAEVGGQVRPSGVDEKTAALVESLRREILANV